MSNQNPLKIIIKCDQELRCKFNRESYCTKDEIIISTLDCESYEELSCEECKKNGISCTPHPEDCGTPCEDFEFKQEEI